MDILISDLNECLNLPSLDKVNFLNEVSSMYPDAISFSSGSPSTCTYGVDAFMQYLNNYINYLSATKDISYAEALTVIGNYASTKGIICGALAKMMEVDEGICIHKESIVVTAGAQEAISLSLQTLFQKNDVLLVVSPFFTGVEGALNLYGIESSSVEECDEGVDFNSLKREIQSIKNKGQKAKAIYCTPNYSNPTGICMSLENRLELIRLCNEHDILIIEDNTYGNLGWGSCPPTLKYLDEFNSVIYIGSFSKSIFPGLRVGFLVANSKVIHQDKIVVLADEMAKIKTMTTNITSHISQAMVGGYLVSNGYSLLPLLDSKISLYEKNLNCLVNTLEEHFGHLSYVSWNIPTGGFFIILNLPFPLTMEDLYISAKEYNVIWLPLNFFRKDDVSPNSIRLAFGNLNEEKIKNGVIRLSHFLSAYMNRESA